MDFYCSSFEEELRTSAESDDPLDPWYRYVIWTEQTFPKGGKDSKLKPLLEKCIPEFKNNEKFNQDHRFMEIWNKYVSFNILLTHQARGIIILTLGALTSVRITKSHFHVRDRAWWVTSNSLPILM